MCVDCGSVVSEGVLAHEPVGGSGMNSGETEASRRPVSAVITAGCMIQESVQSKKYLRHNRLSLRNLT